MSSPRLTAQFGQYYASVPSTGSSPFSSSPSSGSPAFGGSPLLSGSPSHTRRISIRPPTLSGLASAGPGALLRLRGRWRRALATVVLVVLTSGLVFFLADSSSLGEGRGATRFMPAGGFGRDFMGRDDEGQASSSSGTTPEGPLELAPIEVKGDTSRLCLLFPWRDECDRVPGRPGSKRGPFDGLRFSERFGHLFYPAYRARPRPGAKPQPPPDVENQPHAIHYLIERAKNEWGAKVARQSRTLEQVVDEYERRYKRRPPHGFDKWFEFAQKHKFVMVDEFDAMMDRVELYLAVRPSNMVARHQKIQFDNDFWITDKTYTIEVKKHGRHLEAHGPMKDANERPDQMIKLIKGIAKYLPDMNVTFTGHDVPWGTMSGESREVHRKAARDGVLLTDEEADDYRDDWKWDGWARICAPDAPLRDTPSYDDRMTRGDIYEPPKTRSFIKDHVAAMDLCTHPENQLIHGFTAWPGPRPGLIYPLFVATMTSLHTDLLVPPVDQYDYALGVDPAWEDKKHNKLVWRGSTTGANLNIEHFRKWSQRPRLCRLPFAKGKVTVPYAPADTSDELGPVKEFTSRNKALALRYFDFEFLDRPRQCDDPAVCDAFEKEFNWSDWMGPDEQNEYKYMLDVDGNGWSGRFHRLMSTNSLVLKSTIFPEWYQDMIQPWVHYVPVQTDYSDLYPIMAFFLGDEHGQGGHDALAKEIAMAGKKWAETHWRWVDMEVYMYRLLLEYHRIMARDDKDPTSMDM
ncbi:hypothetical protein DMC30DRAFT_386415 [Rhodotorula diobovata]|uniref:Glycosyl transferase CAP10 domain-containing protein n=1 Tax=Rhodotorula diobovata TaxID=5288 RepID=A0A5C5G6Z6_9BASI|nr:hypothetical protein DMC30DRAFT_386415 [Rhodotorula diobovata]